MTAISTVDAAKLFDSTTGGTFTPPTPGETTTRQRALELLGKGVKPSVVAIILQVTPSQVSQYQEDPAFKELLQAKLIESQLAASIRDSRLDALEDRAITAVERSLDIFVKPAEALAALKLVNSLQRRAPVNLATPEEGNTRTVVLSLPQSMLNSVVNIQVSSSNEVVEVNGREMRTMQTTEVLRELEAMQTINALNLERENEFRRTKQLEHQPDPASREKSEALSGSS